MIEQTGTVVSRSGDVLDVRVDPQVGCARCESGQGCGQGLIGQLSGRRAYSVAVEAPASESVAAGDRVVLGMAPGALLGASFLVYLMPVILMAGLATLGEYIHPGSELVPVLTGGVGLAGGFLAVRHLILNGSAQRRFEPRFLRVASGPADELLT